MSRYKRLDLLCMMKQIGMIPVFYHSDFETAKNVIYACVDGGARVVEFTNRGDRAINVLRLKLPLLKASAANKPDCIGPKPKPVKM